MVLLVLRPLHVPVKVSHVRSCETICLGWAVLGWCRRFLQNAQGHSAARLINALKPALWKGLDILAWFRISLRCTSLNMIILRCS